MSYDYGNPAISQSGIPSPQDYAAQRRAASAPATPAPSNWQKWVSQVPGSVGSKYSAFLNRSLQPPAQPSDLFSSYLSKYFGPDAVNQTGMFDPNGPPGYMKSLQSLVGQQQSVAQGGATLDARRMAPDDPALQAILGTQARVGAANQGAGQLFQAQSDVQKAQQDRMNAILQRFIDFQNSAGLNENQAGWQTWAAKHMPQPKTGTDWGAVGGQLGAAAIGALA